MDNNEPAVMVSVMCLTYNHENFIEKTLESLVNQKTSYRYEIIVHDDASTDNTKNIVQKYSEKYPDLVKPIFEEENQYSKKNSIAKIMFPYIRGKYVAWCEGDDYWSSLDKLEMQVDELEKKDELVACISKVEIVTYNGNTKKKFFPKEQLPEGELLQEEYMRYTLSDSFPWQLTGLMIRYTEYANFIINPPKYRDAFRVGDIPLFLYIGLCGKIYYIDETLSCYRTGNPESWVGRHRNNKKLQTEYFISKIEAYKAYDTYTVGKYSIYIQELNRRIFFQILLNNHSLMEMKSPEMVDLYNKLSLTKKFENYIYKYLPYSEKIVIELKKGLNLIR